MIKWKLFALSSAFLLASAAGPSQQPAADSGPVPPRMIAGSISNGDYPSEAIRERAQGNTRMVISVAADGNVTDCRIAQSSGSQALDDRSCAIVRERFRFSPGRDAQGAAVPGQYQQSVRWVLPDLVSTPFAPFLTTITASLRDGQITSCITREDGQQYELPLDQCQPVFSQYPGWESLRSGLTSASHVLAFTPQGGRPPGYQPEWGELHEQFEIGIRIGPDGRVTGCALAGGSAFSECPDGANFVDMFEASSEPERRGRITIAMFFVARR